VHEWIEQEQTGIPEIALEFATTWFGWLEKKLNRQERL
jgi:hypothetical protein